jgi:hypothetical protein
MAKQKTSAPKPRGTQPRQVTLHYRVATFQPELPTGQTIGELLDLAIAKKKNPSMRMENLDDSSDTVRVINKPYRDNGMICARFLDYTEGGALAILQIDDAKDELEIRELAPGLKEQFLEGILTFGILENHVIIAQSKALRSGHFEAHLNWLLRLKAKVLGEEYRVILSEAPARRLKKKLFDVSSVTLSEAIPGATFIRDANPKQSGLEPLISALQAMMPRIQDIFGNKLTPQQALALEELNVSLKISRKRKKGTKTVIDDLAHLLRNVDDVEVTVKAGGTEYGSKDWKLSGTKTIETEAGRVLKLKSAATVMREWLSELLAAERVIG